MAHGTLVVKKTRGALVWRVTHWPARWLADRPYSVTRTEPREPFDEAKAVGVYATEMEARAAMELDMKAHGFEPEPPAGTRV